VKNNGMLTQLKLKNWRSIRDATIDFMPLTMFIGANSSGKSNVLDALRFLKRISSTSAEQAIFLWGGYDKIHSIGVSKDEPTQIIMNLRVDESTKFSYSITIFPNQKSEVIYDVNGVKGLKPNEPGFFSMLEDRWQLLQEGFTMPTRAPVDAENNGDLRVIDSLGANVPVILDYLKATDSALYKTLEDDLIALLQHVQSMTINRTERGTQVSIFERAHKGAESPTISAGTGRIITLLTAYHLLDKIDPRQFGVIAVEEPDTAIHPLLLENFVDLLRGYTTDSERPRQFIMTTHNPQLLNYLKPEEVRIVERDQQGITTVHRTSDEIAQIWLDKYGLGEAWMTRSLGGVPR